MNHYLNTQIATSLHRERVAAAELRAERLRNSANTPRTRLTPGTRWTWFARRAGAVRLATFAMD